MLVQLSVSKGWSFLRLLSVEVRKWAAVLVLKMLSGSGCGAAAEVAAQYIKDGVWNEVAKLRNILEKALESVSKATTFVGKDNRRLPNTSCFATPGWKGEMQVMQMDIEGFAISAGSACSSGKVKSTNVLEQMGLNYLSDNAVRVYLGPETTEDDVMRFAEIWAKKLKKDVVEME